MANEKEMDFETSMQKLNAIVEKLESGELALEESLKLYEEGVRLSQACTKRLSEAQAKIETLMRGDVGSAAVEKPKSKKK